MVLSAELGATAFAGADGVALLDSFASIAGAGAAAAGTTGFIVALASSDFGSADADGVGCGETTAGSY